MRERRKKVKQRGGGNGKRGGRGCGGSGDGGGAEGGEWRGRRGTLGPRDSFHTSSASIITAAVKEDHSKEEKDRKKYHSRNSFLKHFIYFRKFFSKIYFIILSKIHSKRNYVF